MIDLYFYQVITQKKNIQTVASKAFYGISISAGTRRRYHWPLQRMFLLFDTGNMSEGIQTTSVIFLPILTTKTVVLIGEDNAF